jgi:SsrA-binding protein
MAETGIKVIAENRRASFEYFLEDRFEAGLVLVGTEIKSIRAHSSNIGDAYIQIYKEEAYIYGMNIPVYLQGNIFNHDPLRTRKLLLHKKEISRLQKSVKEKGYTIVATKLYLQNGYAKIQIALGKGKKLYDKREDSKRKSQEKEVRQTLGKRSKRNEEE